MPSHGDFAGSGATRTPRDGISVALAQSSSCPRGSPATRRVIPCWTAVLGAPKEWATSVLDESGADSSGRSPDSNSSQWQRTQSNTASFSGQLIQSDRFGLWSGTTELALYGESGQAVRSATTTPALSWNAIDVSALVLSRDGSMVRPEHSVALVPQLSRDPCSSCSRSQHTGRRVS